MTQVHYQSTVVRHRRPVEWAGVILTLALLSVLLQAGSPGFALANEDIWTVAKYFPKAQQQKIEKKQKKDRGAKEAGEKAREQAIPANVDIPNLNLGLYQEYMGKDWKIIAGIYKIESDHGRSNAPGVKSGVNSFGCCAGPGQFHVKNGHGGGIKGSTWDSWGTGRRKDVYNVRYAVPATTRMLKAFKASPNDRTCRGPLARMARKYGADWTDAIRHYNNACWYVEDVLAWSETYGKQARTKPIDFRKPNGLTFTGTHGCDPARDWNQRVLTPEVQGFIIKLANVYEFRISCGATGHSQFVKGTSRESAHWTGRAFDVDMVQGQVVSEANPHTDFGRKALAFDARQVGGPVDLCEGGRCFTDRGHKGHWHVQP